jgi:hypothetical protein
MFRYKYGCGRKYNLTLQPKQLYGSDAEAYFFTQRDGVMYYCEVDKRFKLNPRTKLGNISRTSQLSLMHRDYTEDEVKEIVCLNVLYFLFNQMF